MPNIKINPKGSLYKKEIIQLCPGLSENDFREWLKIPQHKEALLEMGVKPSAHKLPPRAVQYVIEHYGISLE